MAKYVSENNLSSILLKLKDVFDLKYAASENPLVEGNVTVTGHPVNSDHLTTKDYVDRQISNLSYSFVAEEEVDNMLTDTFGEIPIARYRSSRAGVVPIFNDEFDDYMIQEELNNADSMYDIDVLSVTGELPTSISFEETPEIQHVNFVNFNKVNTINTFKNNTNIKTIDLSTTKFKNLTNMSYLFSGCTALQEIIGLDTINVSNVTNLENIFENCISLISLDLTNWHIDVMANTEDMFKNCDELSLIKLKNNDYNTINTIIYCLPDRTGMSAGKIVIADNFDISLLNTEGAQNKNWEISEVEVKERLITQYKFDKSICNNLMPIFNDEFVDYKIEDKYEDYTITSTPIDFRNKLVTRDTHELGRKWSYTPIYLDNGDIEFTCSQWDKYFIDTSDYIGKTINVSFTLTNKLGWCEFEVGTNNTSETVIADWYESEIESFSYSKSFEATDELIFEGMFAILSDISVTVEGEELFPKKAIDKHMPYSAGFYNNLAELFDNNKLEFTHKWNAMYIDVNEYIGKDINISFDVVGLPNDQGWTEFEYGQFDGYKSYYITEAGHEYIIADALTETRTVHCNSTLSIVSNYLYFGGMGGRISNLQIEVLNNKLKLNKIELINAEKYHEPFRIKNTSLVFNRSWWDYYTIDVSEYIGKTMNVSFTLESFDDGTNSHWLELKSTGYEGDHIHEICTQFKSINVNYSYIINEDFFSLQGTCVKMKNIQLIVDGINLYDELVGFNGYLYESDFDSNHRTQVAKKMPDGELWFTYSQWNVIAYDLSSYAGKIITVSFDIDINPDDFWWSEIDYDIRSNNDRSDKNSCIYNTRIIEEAADEYKTIHFEKTHSLALDANTILVLEGMGAYISNLSISINQNVVTRSIYANSLPTTLRFGPLADEPSDEEKNIASSLLICEYLNTEKLVSMESLFRFCTNLISVNTSNWVLDKVKSLCATFAECHSLIELDVSNFNTSQVTDIDWLFYSCHNLTSLNVSEWDTGNINHMIYAFYKCYSLTALNLTKWDVGNVIDMDSMFKYCTSLTELDLNDWDTSNVNNMQCMFCHCNSLTSLNINKWDTYNVTNMKDMFEDCISLSTIDVSNFNTSNVNSMQGMFYYCKSLTSLDLSSFNVCNVTIMESIFNDCSSLISLNNNTILSFNNLENKSYPRSLFPSFS